MSKQEFEEQYTKNSGISLVTYHKLFVTLPCACSYDCVGWAAVNNHTHCIKVHQDLYAPK